MDKAQLDRLAAFFKNDRFATRAGAELVEMSEGHAVVEMRLTPDHWNALDSVQGGAIFTLADFAFAIAATSYGTAAVAVNVTTVL